MEKMRYSDEQAARERNKKRFPNSYTTRSQKPRLEAGFTPSPTKSRRAPFTPREMEFVGSLALKPGKMPPFAPVRALKIIKAAKALMQRLLELARARGPRQANARKRAKAARVARRAGR